MTKRPPCGAASQTLHGATVAAQLDPLFKPIRDEMLPGYCIEVAGAVEESSKGRGAITVGAPLMLFIMFTLLVLVLVLVLHLQLQSFNRALLVMLTAPLGIAGLDGHRRGGGAALLAHHPDGGGRRWR